MKRIALFVVAGFLAGMLSAYALLAPRAGAQIAGHPQGPTNQQFGLVDQANNSAGSISFDASGIPVIVLVGNAGAGLRGKVVRIMCEIRSGSAPAR